MKYVAPLYWQLGLVLAMGLLVFLSACDSGGSNTPGSVTGEWHGSVETDSVTYQLSYSLDRPDDSSLPGSRLVGEGELVGEDTWSFQIPDGSFTEPTLSLTLTLRFNEPPRPILLEGTVGDDYQQITAVLTGGPPRFESESITLTRP